MIRDLQNCDDDIIRKKRRIKKALYSDPDIIEALNSATLDPECPDEYLDIHIYDYIKIPGTQDEVKNMICFDIDDINISEFNNIHKQQVITFVSIVHEDDIKTDYNMSRHDLLAYIIKDIFNWSDFLGGTQFKLISSRTEIVDVKYYVRTQKFKSITPNSLINGNPSRI